MGSKMNGNNHTEARTALDSVQRNNDNNSDNKKPSGSSAKHLSWDEQAIEEHDQLRGTRMKIVEVETPYEYNIPIDDDDDKEEEEEEEEQKQTKVKNDNKKDN